MSSPSLEPGVAPPRPRSTGGLFAALDGLPAHVLVVLGLALALLAPQLQLLRAAPVEEARAAVHRRVELNKIELEEHSRSLPPDMAGEDREKDLARKRGELSARVLPLQKVEIEAATQLAGARVPLIVLWLGRFLLLLGLLVLTSQSDGTRQKVLLVVLLVAMFSSLSNVGLDLLAQGRLGAPSEPPRPAPAPRSMGE